MRPCFFIPFLTKKLKRIIQCPCAWKHLEGEPKYYIDCPYFNLCQRENKQSEKIEHIHCNTVINKNNNGDMEYMVYDKTFAVKIHETRKVERRKLLYRFADGYIFNKNVPNCWERYKHSKKVSGKRAKDLCYNYIYNNEWTYFITLTFSPECVDRTDAEAVKHEYKKFREVMQKSYDPDIRLLCVPETHAKDGALHFHILAGTDKILPIVNVPENVNTWNAQGFYAQDIQTDYKYYMFPIVELKQWKKGRFDQHMYALSFFNKGRNFTSVIDPEHKHMAYNYMAKYMNKMDNLGYGAKRIYATSNLNKRKKLVFKVDGEDEYLKDFILDRGLRVYKSTKKFTIYRNYNMD